MGNPTKPDASIQILRGEREDLRGNINKWKQEIVKKRESIQMYQDFINNGVDKLKDIDRALKVLGCLQVFDKEKRDGEDSYED